MSDMFSCFPYDAVVSPQSASCSVSNCVMSLLLVVDTLGWTANQTSMDLAMSCTDVDDVSNFIWLPARKFKGTSFKDAE